MDPQCRCKVRQRDRAETTSVNRGEEYSSRCAGPPKYNVSCLTRNWRSLPHQSQEKNQSRRDASSHDISIASARLRELGFATGLASSKQREKQVRQLAPEKKREEPELANSLEKQQAKVEL